MTRGSPAEVIVPKAAVPKMPFGFPNAAVLRALNISVRISSVLSRAERHATYQGQVEIPVARTSHRIP